MVRPEPITLESSPDAEGSNLAGDPSAAAQIGHDRWLGVSCG